MDCGPPEYSGDIAGPGVRVSFYLQNFLLVLLVNRSLADAQNALWTFIATSFGLTIAAVVQVGVNKLSLLEGILVSQLAWFANIGTFLALASYSRSKGDDNVVKVAAVMQGYFSMVLTIFMWAYADQFPPPRSPSSPNCHWDIKIVFLFGWKLPALESGRNVALVFASLMILVYTFVTFIECRAWKKHGGSHIRPREHDVESTLRTADRERRGSSGSGRPGHDVELAPRTADRERRGSSGSGRPGHVLRHNLARRPRRRTKWLKTEVDPIFFGIFVSQLIVLTYFISTTELIISGNHATTGDENSAFGFGQVLSLTVVIPSLIALYHAMRKHWIARPEDKHKQEDEKARTRESLFPANDRHNSISRSRSPPNQPLQLPREGAGTPSASGLAPTSTDVGSSLYSISTSN